MSYVDWVNVVPSALSAIATVAAAFAAFGSLKVSRESKQVAEQSALAGQHGTAAGALTHTLEFLAEQLKPLSDLAFDVRIKWAKEIECYDCRELGGTDPRPLRHVLSNAGDMLERHATKDGASFNRAGFSMFSIVRGGMGETSDREYRQLLNRVDGTYAEFESTFGKPKRTKVISSAPAFRWAFYQLSYRVKVDTWREIWTNTWVENGWLRQYFEELQRIKPKITETFYSLNREIKKLEHTVFPIEKNPQLRAKYDQMLGILEALIDHGDLSQLEAYIDDPHDDDLIGLVLYSMGMASLVHKVTDIIMFDASNT